MRVVTPDVVVAAEQVVEDLMVEEVLAVCKSQTLAEVAVVLVIQVVYWALLELVVSGEE